MFDWVYKKRLKDDLEAWVSKGWVKSEGAAAILKELDEDDGRARLPMALAGIGMVCVALALFALIAANWGVIPKSLKLFGIFLTVGASHGLAAYAASKAKPGVADLLTGFATLVFVGGMALIGQIFHLPADWAGGALLVCLGGLAAAWFTGSRASLIVGGIAAIVWQVTNSDLGSAGYLEAALSVIFLAAIAGHAVVHANGLSRWAAICFLWTAYGRWLAETGAFLEMTAGYGDEVILPMLLIGAGGLAALLFQIDAVADLYVKWSSERPLRNHGHWLMTRSAQNAGLMILCGLLVLLLVLPGEWMGERSNKGVFTFAVTIPFLLACLLSVSGLLMAFKTPKAAALFAVSGLSSLALASALFTDSVLVLAALSLSALIGFCALGTWYNNRFWMVCAYLGLTAVSLWLLQVTIGSLLSQSLFFLVAGVVLLGVAFWLARLFSGQGGQRKRTGRIGEAEQ